MFPIPLRTRQAMSTLAVQIVGVGMGYLLHIALARWMGAASYGSYSYAMAWLGLLSIAAALGLPVASVRFVSQYRAMGDQALLRGAIRRFRQIVFASGTGVALAGTAAVLFLSGAPSWLAIAVWLIPLAALVNLHAEVARGLGRPGLSQAPDKILRPLVTLGGATLFFQATGALSIGQAMVAAVCALGTVAVLQAAVLSRVLASLIAAPGTTYRTGEWMRVALSLLTVSLLALLLGQMDLLVAGLFLAPAQIGIYSAAIRVASLIGFVPLSVTIVTSPQIAALYAQHDVTRLQELASHIARLSFWPSFLLAGGIVALATPILLLFGPEFNAARWPLYILAATQLFKAATGPVGYFLDMTGHQAYNARAFAVTTVLGLLLNLIAIPRFGIVGAAIANLSSWIVVMLWLHREVTRRVGIRASILSATGRPMRPRADK